MGPSSANAEAGRPWRPPQPCTELSFLPSCPISAPTGAEKTSTGTGSTRHRPGGMRREHRAPAHGPPPLAAEAGRPICVYGNLPYHLSTPILLALLEHPESWTRACFLLQREFAERVAAPPGTRECGTLSAYTAVWTRPRIAFRIGPGSFHPPPRVESAVLVLERLASPAAELGDEGRFRAMVRALFQQRRKTARNALRAQFPDADAALAAAGLAPDRRGETFTLEELARLSRSLSP